MTTSALFRFSPDFLYCGNTATVPPAARPHKLQATLRSAYVRLSQSRGAKLALLEPHAIPRPAASGRSRPFRCSSSPNCKRFAGLQFGSICLARKSRQKEALETVLYCSLTRAILFDALFGRKTVTFPTAFGSDIVYGFVGADVGIGPYKRI